eukprot:UN26983
MRQIPSPAPGSKIRHLILTNNHIREGKTLSKYKFLNEINLDNNSLKAKFFINWY